MTSVRPRVVVPVPRSAPERPAVPHGRAPHPLATGAWVLGLLLAAFGVVEVLAWLAHVSRLLELRAGTTPLVMNTALAFAAAGAGVAAGARGRLRALRVAGAFDLLLGLAVVAEHLLDVDLHVDQALVHAYLVKPPSAPGRMALNTALCVVAAGAAMLTWRTRVARRVPVLDVAAVVVAAFAVVALFGYAADVPSAQGWHQFSLMALPTALGLCVLAAALLLLARSRNPDPRAALTEHLAVPAGVAAFLATGLVWQAFLQVGGTGATVPRHEAARVMLFVAATSALLLGLTTWLGQRAQRGRVLAETLAEDLDAEVQRRREAEQVARDGEDLLRRFLDALPVGVFIADEDGHPAYVNAVAEGLLGRGAVPGVRAAELAEVYQAYVEATDAPYPPEQMPLVRALAGVSCHVDDMEIRRPTERVLVEVWGSPVTDVEGHVRYGVTAFVDVTARRAAERRLEQQAALLDLARDAIFVRDAEWRVTYWNQGAERLYGWTAEEALGKHSWELLRVDLPAPLEALHEELSNAGWWEGEVVHRTKDGQPLLVSSRWVAERDAQGEVSAVLVINTDVTQQRQAERRLAGRAQQLEEANRELARSNEDLAQFAYAASHDLSEPLRAISGPLSLVARRYDDQLDDDAKRFIGFAVDGCARMQVLIDDLLAFSRVGRLEGQVADIDVGAVLATVLAGLRPVLEDKLAEVTWDPLPTLPAEPTQLRQLLQNLVSNAVKFSRADVPPRVHVAAARAGDDWRFTVTDNGIGIEPQHRERVFGMFKRLHGREAYPGTGIGLALCKKIVERHGGEIHVETGPDGVGSTFVFTLPAARPAPVGSDPEAATVEENSP